LKKEGVASDISKMEELNKEDLMELGLKEFHALRFLRHRKKYIDAIKSSEPESAASATAEPVAAEAEEPQPQPAEAVKNLQSLSESYIEQLRKRAVTQRASMPQVLPDGEHADFGWGDVVRGIQNRGGSNKMKYKRTKNKSRKRKSSKKKSSKRKKQSKRRKRTKRKSRRPRRN